MRILQVGNHWTAGPGCAAAGHGVPVVATRMGGIPELVEHERTGLRALVHTYELAVGRAG